MLDQLVDTDSGLAPKLTAQTVDVEGSVRHLTVEDLEGYSNGRLASARLSYCQAHLDSCEGCRAELEDLRITKSELSGFPRAEPLRRDLERRKRRRGLTVTQVASVAGIFVAAGCTLLWWRHDRPRANKTSAAVSVAQSAAAPASSAAQLASATQLAPAAAPAAQRAPAAPAALPTARAQSRDTRLADEIAGRPDVARSAASAGIQHGKLPLLTDASPSRGRAPTSPATPEANTGFALLGPFGETISETRPEFRWQPLAGAIGYSVVIVDTGLHPVQHSPALRATVWRPRRPLRPGHSYLWEVTATLPGGAKVVASGPSPSETLLRIVPPKLADEIAHFRQGHREDHLVLGVLYAQAGMLTESADELKKVPLGDPSYNTARTLLAGLSSTNPHDAPHQPQ